MTLVFVNEKTFEGLYILYIYIYTYTYIHIYIYIYIYIYITKKNLIVKSDLILTSDTADVTAVQVYSVTVKLVNL